MFERFTEGARAVVIEAQEQARRFGHGYIGCEHLLLAAASGTEPASAALRECGIEPAAVKQEIIRLVGAGRATGLLTDLDRDALASIGIDLDAVRARLEETFGPGALAPDLPGVRRRSGPARRRGPLARALRRQPRAHGQPAADLCGRPPVTGHIPFTRNAKKSLAHSLQEAMRQHDNYIGVQHITLALTGMNQGAIPPILAALAVSPGTVRASILARYRKAS